MRYSNNVYIQYSNNVHIQLLGTIKKASNMKKHRLTLLILSFILPFNIFSYSQNDSLKTIKEPIKTFEKKDEKKKELNNNNNITDSEKTSTEFEITTSDKIAVFSGILALIALCLSIVSTVRTNNLANKDFLLTHRPFVWVENFGYLNAQNIIVNQINKVMIMLLNSPAKFHKENIEYYIIDNQNTKTIIETQELSGMIRYPSEKSQYTNTSSLVTDQIVQGLNQNQELERIINIEYSWLSSEKKYFFKSKWRLDKQYKNWKTVEQFAD
jgi:hypothetical protein